MTLQSTWLTTHLPHCSLHATVRFFVHPPPSHPSYCIVGLRNISNCAQHVFTFCTAGDVQTPLIWFCGPYPFSFLTNSASFCVIRATSHEDFQAVSLIVLITALSNHLSPNTSLLIRGNRVTQRQKAVTASCNIHRFFSSVRWGNIADIFFGPTFVCFQGDYSK
jgi:hypothetical protein